MLTYYFNPLTAHQLHFLPPLQRNYSSQKVHITKFQSCMKSKEKQEDIYLISRSQAVLQECNHISGKKVHNSVCLSFRQLSFRQPSVVWIFLSMYQGKKCSPRVCLSVHSTECCSIIPDSFWMADLWVILEILSTWVEKFLREVKIPIFPCILFEQLNNLTLSWAVIKADTFKHSIFVNQKSTTQLRQE